MSTAASAVAAGTLDRRRARLAGDAAFMAVSDVVFYRKVAEQAVFWAAGACLIFGTQSVLLWVLGATLIGAVYARNLEFVHECLHFTALRSRGLCRLFGTVMAIPMLTSFEEWRVSHGRHHVDVRDEGFAYRPEAITGWLVLLRNLLAVDHFRNALIRCWNAVRHIGTAGTRSERWIRTDFRVMAACLAAGVSADLLLGMPVVLWLWFIPLLPAAVFNFHIQLPEHFGCTVGNGSAFLNSRTIAAGRFARWFVNGNNFHTSHHWLAAAPIRRLATIDSIIRAEVRHVEPSYASFYLQYYRDVLHHLRHR